MTALFGPFDNDFTITPGRFDALGKLRPEHGPEIPEIPEILKSVLKCPEIH